MLHNETHRFIGNLFDLETYEICAPAGIGRGHSPAVLGVERGEEERGNATWEASHIAAKILSVCRGLEKGCSCKKSQMVAATVIVDRMDPRLFVVRPWLRTAELRGEKSL